MSVSFSDVLRTTGASGQRKGLEPYANRVVTLKNFKIETRGRDKDKNGEAKEQRRVLTADVHTEGLKPRRALIPKRYAVRFMEAIELRADESSEPFEVANVLVKVGEHGATLHDPNDFPKSQGGYADEPSESAEAAPRRAGRPRKSTDETPAAEVAA